MTETKEYIIELKNYITYLEDIILIQYDHIETESLLREIDILCNKLIKERRIMRDG